MQYVGNLFSTVTEFYKELNPSTLSGAIDVIAVKHSDGSLHCSPFHVRFGKLQLLRPHEKIVELEVNGESIEYRMKLGEAGEAFFVFESENPVPSEFATSPLISPGDSPNAEEMDYFSLQDGKDSIEVESPMNIATDDAQANESTVSEPITKFGAGKHLSKDTIKSNIVLDDHDGLILDKKGYNVESIGRRTTALHQHNLSTNDLSMTPKNYSLREVKSDFEEGMSSEEDPLSLEGMNELPFSDTEYEFTKDKESEPNSTNSSRRWTSWFSRSSTYVSMSSDDEGGNESNPSTKDRRKRTTRIDKAHTISGGTSKSYSSFVTAPSVPKTTRKYNYAKTLRLTSDQLKSINLKPGTNQVTFSVGKASCSARIFLWNYNDEVVISDIDGTITKSDALGHIFNMVGKDWTHPGVAKLYTDIARNGYKILYLTSRAIGQADTTREYLKRIDQNQDQLPDGPVIMSPDRLFQSLHREVVLRKPHLFKTACLKDIVSLFGENNPFHAGFGNRITDALAYRSVNVPVSRIFTINYNGDIQHELLLGYNSSYIKLTDLVDQIFPPVTGKLVADFNDWNFWKPSFHNLDLDLPDLPDISPKIQNQLNSKSENEMKSETKSNEVLLVDLEGENVDDEFLEEQMFDEAN